MTRHIILDKSQEVNPVTVNEGTVVLRDQMRGQKVEAEVVVDVSRRKAILKPEVSLEPFSEYQIEVRKGVKDTAGNALLQSYYFYFTTGGYQAP
jgi:hypothetical protein